MNKLIPTLLAFTPFLASAAANNPSAFVAPATYSLLAPLGGMTTVSLTEYLQGILVVTIGLAGVLAVVMIVVCAIQMMGSPSVSQKSASKECITNAIFGLLLAVGSWIILNTINTQLLSNDVALAELPAPLPTPAPSAANDSLPTEAGWYFRYYAANGAVKNSPSFPTSAACLAVVAQDVDNGVVIMPTTAGNGTVQCFQVVPPPPGTARPPKPAPGTTPPAGVSAPAVGGGSEAAVRESICGNNSCVGARPIGINKNACVGGNTSCTSVAGLPSSVVDVVKSIQALCSCDVVITGGTEAGHKTHRPNSPIFDFRRSAAVDRVIISNSTQSASSFMGSTRCRYLVNNFWWTEEGDHWHVCQVGQPYWFCTDKNAAGKTLLPGKNPPC